MPERAAELFWVGVAAYGVLGVIVLAVLWAGGLARFDSAAAAAPWQVKAVLAPGMLALWPVMLWRVAGARPAEDRR